jgi:murein DD-endopeptidase MepM/ murein hydrolase activator NlpD
MWKHAALLLAILASGLTFDRPTRADALPDADAVFPLPGVERASSQFKEGEFGAFRPGRRGRRDCGHGHCGVDLCAPQGSAVVAVKGGRVDQIQHARGGEGGRWVRVAHDDGTATWYMHLDALREGLRTGMTVQAGEVLATLGRTGVSSSPTHLHFALTVGKPGHERHLDPTRFLASAALLAAPLDLTPAPAPPTPTRTLRSSLPEL